MVTFQIMGVDVSPVSASKPEITTVLVRNVHLMRKKDKYCWLRWFLNVWTPSLESLLLGWSRTYNERRRSCTDGGNRLLLSVSLA